eukprot:Skav225958  [mRNA]  locus=scaffold6030:60786:65045:- [translate_table: standard]
MALPVESEAEARVLSLLKNIKDDEPLPPAVESELVEKLPVAGQLAWEWLLVLFLNYGARGRRAEELACPSYPRVWSPGQKAVAQRLVHCVALFCDGNRSAEVRSWKERSLRRGPGFYGVPLQKAYPLRWDLVKDAFEHNEAYVNQAGSAVVTQHLKEPVKWTRSEVELVHRTGKRDLVADGAIVYVEDDLDWEQIVGGLFKLQLVEAEHQLPSQAHQDQALVGAYGIHRTWKMEGQDGPKRLLSLVFDVDLVNLLYRDQEGDAGNINRCSSRGGRLVAHPSGLKVAFPEHHGEGYEVFFLDEPWRKDFIINKSVRAEVFGLQGEHRRPRLKFMPRSWHVGMMVVHGSPQAAPVHRLMEGWPLSTQSLSSGAGWFCHGRNPDGTVKLWLDNGEHHSTIKVDGTELSPSSRGALKPWMMKVYQGELRFENRLILDLVGGVIYLLQNEGTDKVTLDDILGVLGVMAHMSRLSTAGSTMVEPVIRRTMQMSQIHLSLDFGDHLWLGLFATLLHGIPLQSVPAAPLAIDVTENSGGSPSPTAPRSGAPPQELLGGCLRHAASLSPDLIDWHAPFCISTSGDLGTGKQQRDLHHLAGSTVESPGQTSSLELMPRRVIRAEQSRQARAKARQKVGSLQSQVVQPATLRRYEKAVHGFLDFLIQHSLPYPQSNPALDAAVCHCIEELWENGDPRGWAGDLLSGLGHLFPSVKGHLAGGWRLHAAWGRAELPLRALPFTPKLVYALAQSAFNHQWKDTGVLLVLGFYRYPRSGELFQARKADFTFDRNDHGVWSLTLTKSGQRVGARESLVLDDSWIGGLLRAYLAPLQPGDLLTRVSPATQRLRLKTLLRELQVSGNFRWYSCRRGGATHHFRCTNNMALVCHVGRWNCAKTARIYITDGLACLTDFALPAARERHLQRLALRARPDFETA